jgi:transposase
VTNLTQTSANQPIVSSDADFIDHLAPYWKQVTQKLHPLLETSLDLSPQLFLVAEIFEVIRVEEHVPAPSEGLVGRKQIDRRPIARAFLAKAAMNLTSTRQLIEFLKQSSPFRSLCGIKKVPSEATFSRAFADFAKENLGDKVHSTLITKFVGDQVVMHCSHDTTAVEAREKAVKKEKTPPPMLKKSVVVPGKKRFALPES